MRQQNWSNAVMNHIDPGLVEQAAAPRAQRRAVRPIRIAVIAACLCAVLVGGAFAAENIFGIPIFKPVETSHLTGEAINGFTATIEPAESVVRLPVDRCSAQARDLAAGLEPGTLGLLDFGNWEEAEEFLGIDLMDNPVLENAGAEAEPVCSVTVTAADGILTGIKIEAAWLLNYVEQEEREIGVTLGDRVVSGTIRSRTPVRIDLTVQCYTEHSAVAADEVFLLLAFPEDWTLTSESYTAPSGLAASIVGVHSPSLGYTVYYAQFALNGNAVTIRAAFGPDSGHALATLKEVLDAF